MHNISKIFKVSLIRGKISKINLLFCVTFNEIQPLLEMSTYLPINNNNKFIV
jgi:hypothetical protein